MAVLAMPSLAWAEETVQSIRVTIGETITVTLRENPSTGFRWSLSEPESSNLSIVTISDAGFEPSAGSPPIGAPGSRRWRIKGVRAGSARAVFRYSRPWEQAAPIHRHKLTIEVTGP
jgi:inhibitor of cysteine peptidase